MISNPKTLIDTLESLMGAGVIIEYERVRHPTKGTYIILDRPSNANEDGKATYIYDEAEFNVWLSGVTAVFDLTWFQSTKRKRYKI